jgi:hypothetical protein
VPFCENTGAFPRDPPGPRRVDDLGSFRRDAGPVENLIVRFRDVLASIGETPPAGVSMFFGTQHIITDQWVRLGSRFGGDLACFLDPSPPIMPLASFGNTVAGFVRGMASFGESSPPGVSMFFGTQHIITDQWVRLGSRFGRDLACFLDPSPRSCHWLRLVIRLSASFEEGETGFVRGARAADAIGFVRGNGARGRAQVVDRYELSKSGIHENPNFIIGGRPERVPGIR